MPLSPTDRALLGRLNAAAANDDDAHFQATLDELLESRESEIRCEAARLAGVLHEALARFGNDSRIASLADGDIPDARQRLSHVVYLTADAAHRTLDLIEQSVPLADEIARGAVELASAPASSQAGALNGFLDRARDNCERVRSNLTEVMLAQGFQDLTGQIIQRVHALIGEVELVLADLMHVHGLERGASKGALRDAATLEGPAIPGVARTALADQGDVDDLMEGLGL